MLNNFYVSRIEKIINSVGLHTKQREIVKTQQNILQDLKLVTEEELRKIVQSLNNNESSQAGLQAA